MRWLDGFTDSMDMSLGVQGTRDPLTHGLDIRTPCSSSVSSRDEGDAQRVPGHAVIG